jgi:hypothetical protein
MEEMAMDAFGRTTDLPGDHPLTQYLEEMGMYNTNPDAFPDRSAREGITDTLLGSMSGIAGAGGGGPGGPGGAGGGGGGQQQLPARTDTSALMAALGDKPPPLPPPPELPGRAESPGSLAALQAPAFTPGMGPPPARSQATRGQLPRFGVSRHQM